MLSQPNLTFIIPHYEDHKRLAECISYLSCQDNIEIIIIDDASPKGPPSFSQKNVRVICNATNQGPSACRNKGIEEASGDYVMFIDSDDLTIGSPYDIMISATNQTEMVDIILCRMEGEKLHENLLAFEGISQTFVDNIFFSKLTNFTPHIYRKKFLVSAKIQFPTDLRLGEDLIFLQTALVAAQSIIVSNSTTYKYRRRENSLSSRRYNLEDHYMLLERLPKEITKLLKNFPDHLQTRLSMSFIYRLRSAKSALQLPGVDQARIFMALRQFIDMGLKNNRTQRKAVNIYWPPSVEILYDFLKKQDSQNTIRFLIENDI